MNVDKFIGGVRRDISGREDIIRKAASGAVVELSIGDKLRSVDIMALIGMLGYASFATEQTARGEEAARVWLELTLKHIAHQCGYELAGAVIPYDGKISRPGKG